MKLVVCFPGIGYHCDKPLLYYGRRVAESVGYKERRICESDRKRQRRSGKNAGSI